MVTTTKHELPAIGRARDLTRTSRNAAGRKPSRKSEIVQERILDAAAKVFATKGYQLAKLSDIANEVGVHVTAIGYHFPTKDTLAEELINSLVSTVHRRVRASVEALPEQTPPRDRILAAATEFLCAILDKTEYITAHGNVVNQVPQEVRDRHFSLLAAFNGFWRGLVREACDAGAIRSSVDPSLATQMLMGTLIWTREWYKPGPKSPAQIAAEIVNTLFDGFAPERNASTEGQR